MQNSGIIKRRIKQLSSRLSSARSQILQSNLTAFSQDDEDLMLTSLQPWQTADVGAGRVNPCLFSPATLVRVCSMRLPASLTRADGDDALPGATRPVLLAIDTVTALRLSMSVSLAPSPTDQMRKVVFGTGMLVDAVQKGGGRLYAGEQHSSDAVRSPRLADGTPLSLPFSVGAPALRLLHERMQARLTGGSRLEPELLHWTYPSAARQRAAQSGSFATAGSQRALRGSQA